MFDPFLPPPTFARILLCLGLGLAAAAPGAAQNVPPNSSEATPENHGDTEGRIDGRRAGIEEGQDLGRAQAYAAAWLRGFNRGLTHADTWPADDSRDLGERAGSRPGRAAGLDAGHVAGKQACGDAFLRLQGRPTYRTEAPPEPPPPPAAEPFAPCDPPASLRLSFPHDRWVSVSPVDCDQHESPLGWEVPEADYPDITSLRQRARDDGYEGDAVVAWIRGYKDAFKSEFQGAFRQQRDMAPAQAMRDWENQGVTDGRREGMRRRACRDFGTGFEQGYRDGFDEGFARGWREGWAEAEQVHVENPVVRITAAELRDENGDGVIEPGEGLAAALTIANAGMADADQEPLAYEGTLSVAARGAIRQPLPAQSRRDERIELGRADNAPFGAGLEVRLRGWNGDERVLSATISRPVVLDGATAALDVLDGKLVARVRPQVRSLASKTADRALRVTAGDASAELGPVQAGERREPELVVPAAPSSLAAPSSGDVELRSADELWVRKSWSLVPRVGDSVRTAARLPAGSRDLEDGLAALSRRLLDELNRSLDDPKLYRRLDEGSDLAELGAALKTLPPSVRPLFEQRLAAPILARAEAKGTPRKVRKAVREALGRE